MVVADWRCGRLDRFPMGRDVSQTNCLRVHRIGVGPELWIEAEIVRGRKWGV